MQLDHAWIAAHIPHHGRMCLLDEVLSVGVRSESPAAAAAHRAADHPLRAHGRLGAACGIEFAAQAMAVHGALVAGAITGSAVIARAPASNRPPACSRAFAACACTSRGSTTSIPISFAMRCASRAIRGRSCMNSRCAPTPCACSAAAPPCLARPFGGARERACEASAGHRRQRRPGRRDMPAPGRRRTLRLRARQSRNCRRRGRGAADHRGRRRGARRSLSTSPTPRRLGPRWMRCSALGRCRSW